MNGPVHSLALPRPHGRETAADEGLQRERAMLAVDPDAGDSAHRAALQLIRESSSLTQSLALSPGVITSKAVLRRSLDRASSPSSVESVDLHQP